MGKYAFSTFEERVVWLLKNPKFITSRYFDRQTVIGLMKKDGLISRKTYFADVKLDDEVHQAKIRFWQKHA